jgi:hypothetical protein
MPYVSDKQRKYFNANKKMLEKQGVDVNEWNKKSKGLNLPEKAPSSMNEKKKKSLKSMMKNVMDGKGGCGGKKKY